MYQKIEIHFPIAVALPEGWEYKLDRLVAEVCQKYESEHPDRVMWPMGHGSKINWSQADAAFLGRAAAPGAPTQGEPSHDDSIYEVTVSERERYETDPNRTQPCDHAAGFRQFEGETYCRKCGENEDNVKPNTELGRAERRP